MKRQHGPGDPRKALLAKKLCLGGKKRPPMGAWAIVGAQVLRHTEVNGFNLSEGGKKGGKERGERPKSFQE